MIKQMIKWVCILISEKDVIIILEILILLDVIQMVLILQIPMLTQDVIGCMGISNGDSRQGSFHIQACLLKVEDFMMEIEKRFLVVVMFHKQMPLVLFDVLI